MKNLLRIAAISIVLAALLPAPGRAWDRKNTSDNQFILRGKAGRVSEIIARHGLTVLEVVAETDPGEDVVLVEGPASMTPEQQLELVAPDEEVLGLEPIGLATLPEADLDQSTDALLEQSTDALLEALATTGTYSDGQVETLFDGPLWAGYANQPAAQLLEIHAAHAAGAPGSAYGTGIVAIIDNGVDPDHPMLAGALVPGYDFIAERAGVPSEWDNLDPLVAAALQQSTDALLETALATLIAGEGGIFHLEQSTDALLEAYDLPPTFGHGTMVAGLVRLVAPGARIMPLRAFDAAGTANMFDIVRAIYFAVDHGAQVINMSFSTEEYSAELARAVNYAHRNGVVAVAAAGNKAERIMTYPAALGFAVGVASTDYDDALSIFSNFGSDLAALSAPGEQLVSTYPGGSYAAAYGTSFAAPLVSGTVALLHDTTGNGGIKQASNYFQALLSISEGATFIPGLSSEIGLGRLNVEQTVVNN